MRITVLIAALLLLACGVGLAYLDKLAGAALIFATAIFCLIFAFLSEFRRFKGLGVEAELLERKIEEADVILTRIRVLTAPLAELLFTLVARMGRWDAAVPRRDRFRVMGEFEDGLRGLGISDATLARAKLEWHRFNLTDLARPVVLALRQVLKKKAELQHLIVQGFPSPISGDELPLHSAAVEEWRRISDTAEATLKLLELDDMTTCAAQIRQFVESCPFLSESERKQFLSEHAESLRDLEHYGKHLQFRRLDVWLAGGDE